MAKWLVRVSRTSVEYGFITVEADARYKAQDEALDKSITEPRLIDWSGERKVTNVAIAELTQQ